MKTEQPEPDCPRTCSRCQAVRTTEGQPSKRWFYSCGSYLYEGEGKLRDQSDLCSCQEALRAAAELIDEIMRGQVNSTDECEKWLRAFAPQYLVSAKEREA